MAERITPDELRAVPGLAAWRVESEAASVRYRTPDFAAGARFIGELARIADEIDHHPDVDLRYGSLHIHTTTHSRGGLTDLDVALALRISALARTLGFEPIEPIEPIEAAGD